MSDADKSWWGFDAIQSFGKKLKTQQVVIVYRNFCVTRW